MGARFRCGSYSIPSGVAEVTLTGLALPFTPKTVLVSVRQPATNADLISAYVTGAPLSCTSTYEAGKTYPQGEEWRYRSVQQKTDKPTADFIAWLKEQKLLKAILCGHLHHFFKERFSPTAMQYVCSATFKGDAYAIRFV